MTLGAMPEWLHLIVRSLGAVFFLFVVTKLIGKRQLSQMTFFEYTVGIAIGDIVGYMATEENGSLLNGAISLSIFALFPILLGILAMKSKIVRNVVEGKARVLIQDGKVLEHNLRKERLTTDELLEQLRLKNAFRIADVEFALMEPNGQVSVMMKKAHSPLTPLTLGLDLPTERAPQAVIMDGTIMDESLAAFGRSRGWLKEELAKRNIAVENVYLGQVDAKGRLYIDLYNDK